MNNKDQPSERKKQLLKYIYEKNKDQKKIEYL